MPIYGVPVASKYLRGEDSLYSIVQMPKGIPVATFAIGEAGAANAALHVIANLAVNDAALAKQLTYCFWCLAAREFALSTAMSD